MLVALGAVILAQTASFFNVDSLDQGAVDQVLDRTADQSSDGDSSFDSPRLSSPGEYPYAVRVGAVPPVPVGGRQRPGARRRRRGLRADGAVRLLAAPTVRGPWHAVRTPYVAFALAYTAMFVFAFSSIGNFGLLTRQRTQVLPFVLVLLAVPPRATSPSRARRRRRPRPSPPASLSATPVVDRAGRTT